MANRMSSYSLLSESPGAGGIRSTGPQAAQLSTTTLLNAVHNVYLQSQPYVLDAGTSLVVNTWLTSANGPAGATVDAALAARAWEHARRRAEDGCIILGSLHTSAPSVMTPFLQTLPVSLPSTLLTALAAIRPFVTCVTPHNASAPLHGGLAVSLTLSLSGSLSAASLSLTQSGINTAGGLLAVPGRPGHRAFDVFYYLLTSASTPAEREFLGLKAASSYALLSRSGTYDPPSYLPAADDAAAADDFRAALKDIGIKGSAHRALISTLAGLLKLGNAVGYGVGGDALEEICEDAAGLLGMEPDVLLEGLGTEERGVFIAGVYEALVDWVVLKANEAVAAQLSARSRDGRGGRESLDGRTVRSGHSNNNDNGDTVCITVVEVPDPTVGKALALRGVFDDSTGINSEMAQDGLDISPAGSSVLKELQGAVAEAGPDLGIMTGPLGRDRQMELDRREAVLEKIGLASDHDGFLRRLLFPAASSRSGAISLGVANRLDLAAALAASRAWYHLSMHPTDDSPSSLAALPSVTSAWSAGTVSRQLRAWRLPEWANRRNKQLDFTADFDVDEFVQRYAALGCRDGRDGIESWILERGWSNGAVVVGRERVWMRENAWWEAESMLDLGPAGGGGAAAAFGLAAGAQLAPESGYSAGAQSGYFPPMAAGNAAATPNSSSDRLVGHHHQQHHRNFSNVTLSQNARAPSVAPSGMRNVSNGDYGLGTKGDTYKSQLYYGDGDDDGDFPGATDAEKAGGGRKIETKTVTLGRRVWAGLVWALTFWIPSPLLRYVGRMRRPDVRMAWREKVVLVFIIFLINAAIIFWIIFFGQLLCPNADKVWSVGEVTQHKGDNDFWVSIRGRVYDISKFWKIDHGSTNLPASRDQMEPLAGLNLDEYFMPPLTKACPGLGIDGRRTYLEANRTAEYPTAEHVTGFRARDHTGSLSDEDWYFGTFLPAMAEYFKGDVVWLPDQIRSEGLDLTRMWVTYEGRVYDLTDLYHSQDVFRGDDAYDFLDAKVSDAVQQNVGLDVTDLFDGLVEQASGNSTERARVLNSINCIKNAFYVGVPDFRVSARCQVNNWILLAFTIILCTVILTKFLAALQFGSKRRPATQDKFVICQVPAYTEGEDSLRKAIDSLTALQYDNKRKLICVICDGVIVGQGNDRPTPKIVLDILGVDPKVDPPALPFKSVGAGSDQLNYGKVYSGLYEFEGNVVPYVVVVKVGKPAEAERAKPGNRGKRDSQILLMSFLNRVHHRAPMNPLELEMFHQVNNVIGVDPELYEYLFMVDADTCVMEDSLNRLVAACANDAKIGGICGETGLQNDEKSWWTMIQVYEYFISHNLAKAFESLFGSVTCLPGCFSMYRIRTVDKGKPLIISDAVIRDYAVCDVDTLHKKNLLSLGEDRYLTTLMTKHFPFMSNKFVAEAKCQTAAPESWSVLLSQRRRWINSTIHNLVELMRLREMCGFCCFSMRFVVFIDLFGTIILPATCVYLGWLIYRLATNTGQFPLISLIMLAAVYGLQALIFILKRQWQHIGWMIIYIIAFPIYSFVLPIYSFWNQDNFSWGNTRVVIGEKGNKQVVAVDGEPFDPRSIPLQEWDAYALANNLPGRRGYDSPAHGPATATATAPGYAVEDPFEKDESRSVYSAAPGSFRGQRSLYMSPPSPAYNAVASRSSTMGYGPYGDQAAPAMMPSAAAAAARQSMISLGGDLHRNGSPYQATNTNPFGTPSPHANEPSSHSRHPSMVNLRGAHNGSPALSGYSGGNRASAVVLRPGSSFDFQRGNVGPDEASIVDAIQGVLREVDLDTVTKKQVRALVEQRLQTELVGDKRVFMDRQIDRELEMM